MEDSGIDSEDRQSTPHDEMQMATHKQHTTTTTTTATNFIKVDVPAVTTKHMADMEVVFRGASGGGGGVVGVVDLPKHKTNENANKTTHKTTSVDDADADADADDDDDGEIGVYKAQPPNTCRILQRKLELKVERAKRNYSQYQEEHARKSQTANLIPISRLSIPGDLEQKPLVDYKSDSSDDPEEISFFPAKLKNARRLQKKAELTDTFSIQEMTIDSDLDSDDSGSQNLELLPPTLKGNVWEKLKSCFGCASYAS